jgi:hypothetical protein
MKYHALRADVCCPFCGRPNLVYKRPGQRGDIYRCPAECGGCERTILHRRQKGKSVCGITPILNFGELGAWKACSVSGNQLEIAQCKSRHSRGQKQ